jgi:DNA-binding MarR family transcriptional regulator
MNGSNLEENFEENIGLLIHDVARLLRVLYDRQMASIGLTRSQWWLLTYLYFNEGINQSELAILLDIEKAPLSRLLERMELKGWVNRKIEGKDRRIKTIYLSDSIKPLLASMRDKAADYRKESLSILDMEDLNKLRDLLQILKKDLSKKSSENILNRN